MTGIEMTDFVETLSIEELNTLASKVEREKNRRNSIEKRKAEEVFWEAAKHLYEISPTYELETDEIFVSLAEILYFAKKL